MNILYTVDCHDCIQLESLLKQNNIEYLPIRDINEDLSSVPILEVDGKRMDYEEAIEWILNMKGQQRNGNV